LGAALDDYWPLSSQVREGVRWLTELLALPQAAERTLLRARALTAAGGLHAWISDPEAFLRFAEEALAISRELDHPRGVAETLASLGWAQLQIGNLELARDNLTEARKLHIGLGNRRQVADCTNGLGILALLEGRPDRARECHENALAMFQDLHEPYWVGLTEVMVAGVNRAQRNGEATGRRYRAALSAFRQIDNAMGTAWALYGLAELALHRGQPERALRLIAASDALRAGVEMPALATVFLGDVGARARARLDEATAERLYQEGSALGLEEAVAYALKQDT
jgi:tetratricopeptide (TPR) repeat protein